MRAKSNIPVRTLADTHSGGIAVISGMADGMSAADEVTYSHRHDYHIFLFVEQGTVTMEVDFELAGIKAPAILYVHPNQVHRITKISSSVLVHLVAMTAENIRPEYIDAFEKHINPAGTLGLEKCEIELFIQSATFCSRVAALPGVKEMHTLLRDACNAFAGLLISKYLARGKACGNANRFTAIARQFNHLLDTHYTKLKRPSDYAALMNISTAYLNECVKAATGVSVSAQIHSRVMLEAKRLLYHSDNSIKQIAEMLGYDDHAYFSRLFTNIVKMTPTAFRSKNRD
jgi:AraC-like DNA-binding protein/mannose-6-phosphate isomerase-like protein (cupin superfamily)